MEKMERRVIGIFCSIVLLMVAGIFRVYSINMSDYITMAASVQGQYELRVSSNRGIIYDRSFSRLVSNDYNYVAAVLPTPQAATELLSVTPEEEKEALMERLSAGRPFTMTVNTNQIYAAGVDVFRTAKRYGEEQLAPHIVGYLGSENNGVAGIEKAYDNWLTETGGELSVLYQMDALGHAMRDTTVGVNRDNDTSQGGVVLTLDARIQELTQSALSSGTDKGAAVVMDISTGDILAMASVPTFDQNNIAASLASEDAPFINRAISGYNIGSVFKIITSAAALENNISRYRTYECQGYIDVEGQIFRCNNHAIHGEIDMARALQVSCNTYFIDLALDLGPEYILSLCQHLGLSSATELADGLLTQPGNLPSMTELRNPAAVANFGFGQGSSLATPLQMAQVVATIANDGASVTPRLVRGLTEDGITFSQQNPMYTSNQILSIRTAQTLQELMVSVIEEGSGRTARPLLGGAGGKTSSAQTGQIISSEDENEEDKELVHAWFAGFYPAENPRYSIVIFAEGGESGEQVAAPIFKQIADGIGALES